MRDIKEIIVHCSATRPEWLAEDGFAAQINEIRRWHVEDRGWSDIGYHFLVSREGAVTAGRPLTRIGAHVAGHNTGTLGVCLLGGHGSAETDAFSDNFTDAQDLALRELIRQLRDRFGDLKVTGHNQYAAKACPGFNVPRWLSQQATPAKQAPDRASDAVTDATRLRWRLAEIRDFANDVLEGRR